ncbi:MAG: class I SAM-dependent methyltransferase [Proteobacteria bacterium]|nr:class I SAM-dependent methyltransferase [Pseudomonadota bacterium]MCZ6781839.1 class I SAM-dependent methyltransferase [Pseudomonadota bacterium]
MSSEDLHRERLQRERRHFEQRADQFDEPYWAERRPIALHRRQMRTRALVEAASGGGALVLAHMLEVGCGTGNHTEWLVRQSEATVVASDLTTGLLRRARSLAPDRVRLAGADASCLPFRNESFDAVVGNAILHHLALERAVPEMLRVLRPGGRLCFAEPNLANPHVFLMLKIPWLRRLAGATEDETAFLRGRIRRTLEGLGLERVTVRPFDFLYPLVPRRLIGALDRLGRALEATPGVREIAGSLLISGEKPALRARS